MKNKNLKRIMSVSFCVMLACCMMISQAFATDLQRQQQNENVNVKKVIMPQTTDAKQVVFAASELEDEVLAIDDEIEKMVDGATDVYQSDLTDKQTAELDAIDGDVIVEDNIAFQATETDVCVTDEDLAEIEPTNPDWNIEMINTEGEGADSDQVKVAIMDSGIEAISDVPLAGSVNLVEDEQELPEYMNDMTGHGTAVGSIVAQIAPNAEIYSVRVLDAGNNADLARIVRGVYWCIDNDIDVINMSFGTVQNSEILQRVISQAEQRGITVVASAGNGGDDGVEYPAAYEQSISVGAVDHEGNKADFSATGTGVDVVAPGENVQVETVFGMHTWKDGTSMAAPHVTGEVARLLAKDNGKSPDFIRDIIADTAKVIGDVSEYGSGLADVGYAEESYDEYAANYEESDNNAIDKNTEEPTTFAQGEVTVQARWSGNKHIEATDNGIDNLNDGTISSVVANCMKRGAVFPDVFHAGGDISSNLDENGNKLNKTKVLTKYWHGLYKSDNDSSSRWNYIIYYRFITKMAAFSGDTESFKKGVTGMSTTDFEKMKANVSLDGLGSGNNQISWKEAIDDDFFQGKGDNAPTGLGEDIYTGSSNRKAKLRRAFLYGMAIHQATDVFAHSAHNEDEQRIVHSAEGKTGCIDGADTSTVCPNRFKDAKAAAQRTVKAYMTVPDDALDGQQGSIGGISTFAPAKSNQGTDEGYYLARVIAYAKEASETTSTSQINEWFGKLNIDK